MITDREVVKSYIDAVSDMTGNDGKAKALEALERLCALQSQPPAKPEPQDEDCEPCDLMRGPPCPGCKRYSPKPEPRGDALEVVRAIRQVDIHGNSIARKYRLSEEQATALLASSQGQGEQANIRCPNCKIEFGYTIGTMGVPQPSGLREAAKWALECLEVRGQGGPMMDQLRAALAQAAREAQG